MVILMNKQSIQLLVVNMGEIGKISQNLNKSLEMFLVSVINVALFSSVSLGFMTHIP